MAKGSDLFVAALENEGVDRIFGVPGEENLDIVESLRTLEHRARRSPGTSSRRRSWPRPTAGSPASPGVCLSTLGPGALNLATGAAYAHLGAMPMILITGQKAILSSQQARFQIVDIVAADEAADQALAPDRQHREHPDLRPRRVPGRDRGTARPRAPRAARGRRG